MKGRPWSRVYTDITMDPSVNDTAHRVYTAIKSIQGDSKSTRTTMRYIMSRTPYEGDSGLRRVRRAIANLVSTGWLVVVASGKDVGKANEYRALDEKLLQLEAPSASHGVGHQRPTGRTIESQGGSDTSVLEVGHECPRGRTPASYQGRTPECPGVGHQRPTNKVLLKEQDKEHSKPTNTAIHGNDPQPTHVRGGVTYQGPEPHSTAFPNDWPRIIDAVRQANDDCGVSNAALSEHEECAHLDRLASRYRDATADDVIRAIRGLEKANNCANGKRPFWLKNGGRKVSCAPSQLNCGLQKTFFQIGLEYNADEKERINWREIDKQQRARYARELASRKSQSTTQESVPRDS